jgi:hypothetical protein
MCFRPVYCLHLARPKQDSIYTVVNYASVVEGHVFDVRDMLVSGMMNDEQYVQASLILKYCWSMCSLS